MIFWPSLGRMFGLENLTMDATLGEAARTYSHWLDPDDVQALLQTPGSDAELAGRLGQIVAGDVPGFDSTTAGDVPRVDHAALVSMAGDILATDDPDWTARGMRVTDFERATTREVTARSLMLNGCPIQPGMTSTRWPWSMSVRRRHSHSSVMRVTLSPSWCSKGIRSGTCSGLILEVTCYANRRLSSSA
jgi:hypothetical protein